MDAGRSLCLFIRFKSLNIPTIEPDPALMVSEKKSLIIDVWAEANNSRRFLRNDL
jgi:hypothetical protein